MAGRDIYVLGSNPASRAPERRSRAQNHVLGLCLITGALCGLAGWLLYLSRYGVVNPGSAGKGMELVVIAAGVIGGTNVTGGTGSVLGVVLGCLLLGTITNALAVAGIDENWQQLTYGAIILVAIIVDTTAKACHGAEARSRMMARGFRAPRDGARHFGSGCVHRGMIVESPKFLDFRYLLSASPEYSETGILALGMTLVIVCGEIDLSVASTLALVACVVAKLFEAHWGVMAAIAGLGLGTLLGLP